MTRHSDETAISGLLQAQARAIRSKDADAVLSHYVPDLVLYDLAPPLARTGAEALDRDTLIAWFETWQGPIHYDLKDLAISTSGDLAFVHGFVRISGTKTSGQASSVWTRPNRNRPSRRHECAGEAELGDLAGETVGSGLG